MVFKLVAILFAFYTTRHEKSLSEWLFLLMDLDAICNLIGTLQHSSRGSHEVDGVEWAKPMEGGMGGRSPVIIRITPQKSHDSGADYAKSLKEKRPYFPKVHFTDLYESLMLSNLPPKLPQKWHV